MISAKPFTFAPQSVKSVAQDSEDKGDSENKDEDDEEPPKPDFKPVTEEGAIYEQRYVLLVLFYYYKIMNIFMHITFMQHLTRVSPSDVRSL